MACELEGITVNGTASSSPSMEYQGCNVVEATGLSEWITNRFSDLLRDERLG